MDGLLAMLGSQSPAVVLLAVALGVVLPKLIDLFFKSRQSRVTAEQTSIKHLMELTNDLYKRVESLESDLDTWKTKYFELQKDFNSLEIHIKTVEAGLDQDDRKQNI